MAASTTAVTDAGLRAIAAGGQQVDFAPIEQLVPYARNARTHTPAQVAQIKAAILEFGWTNPVLADAQGIIAGHGRVLAARELYAAGYVIRLPSGAPIPAGTVPRLDCTGWSDAKRRAYIILDNQVALQAGWDEELLKIELESLQADGLDMDLLGFDDADLQAFMDPSPGPPAPAGPSLSDRFMIPPFTVLNAREGWWQDRKRQWIALGIQSELGRGANAPDMSAAMAGITDPQEVERWNEARRKPGSVATGGSPEPMARGYVDGRYVGTSDKAIRSYKGQESPDAIQAFKTPGSTPSDHGPTVTRAADGTLEYSDTRGTSIFDPVLCELAYRWFSPAAGHVLDPFAGGSVRGIVAAVLGRSYTGIDLAAGQLDANIAQAAAMEQHLHAPIEWRHGDSRTADLSDVDADLVFSCPPYADLEVYSDDPADISAMPYAQFLAAYREIIARACARLRDDRFAVFVVGEVRDPAGAYRNFVGDTVEAFRAAGLAFYNEAILVTAVGSLPIRVGKQFTATRKLGKTHQQVLVFLKGDGRRATEACGQVDVSDALRASGDDGLASSGDDPAAEFGRVTPGAA